MTDLEMVTTDYRTRAAEHAAAAATIARTLRLVGMGRLVCFLLIAAEIAASATDHLSTPIAWGFIPLTIAAFVALVAWHRRVRSRERLERDLERECLLGVDRALRNWNALPAACMFEFQLDHPYAGDLHLVGPHSLARLLPAMSPAARAVMSEWLLAEHPPAVPALIARQNIVRELASQHGWRERMSVHASRLAGSTTSLDAFFDWAESSPWLQRRVALRWAVRALTVATVLAIVAAVVHLAAPAIVLFLVIINLAVTAMARGELAATLDAASSRTARLRGYGAIFRHVGTLPAERSELRDLLERIGGGPSGRAFASLDQLAATGEVRLSTMGHFALQALVLWDFHVVDALETWQRRYGHSVRDWVRALAELEAQSAFGTVSHENPAWTFPTFRPDATGVLTATMLAHPLLPAPIRVGNDVTLGPPGTILLVTGSNMAGKTTLLRATALNVVLAQAGAPVCAATLELSRFRVRTSMQATDSLEQGLSLFMAELVRLKSIVDAAVAPSDCSLLYLADEILRGTNAADRHSAIVTVLGTLVRAGAVGVVATHDPDLAHASALESHIRAVNLIEQFRDGPEGTAMWFDYHLRPGIATTRNAIKLLEMVGLSDAPGPQ